jgi:protein phosphatase
MIPAVVRIELPDPSLVALIGTTGSGKSTFARRHFRPTEVLSSDFFRGLVSDDENDQAATAPAFEALHFVAARRLAAGRLTVIDATNVQLDARRPLLALALRYRVVPVAIVLDIPEKVCGERNRARPDRRGLAGVLARQRRAFSRSVDGLDREGFRQVWTVRLEDLEAVEIARVPAWSAGLALAGDLVDPGF